MAEQRRHSTKYSWTPHGQEADGAREVETMAADLNQPKDIPYCIASYLAIKAREGEGEWEGSYEPGRACRVNPCLISPT